MKFWKAKLFWISGITFIICSIIFLFSSVVMPWYFLKTEYLINEPGTIYEEYTLFEKRSSWNNEEMTSISYDNFDSNSEFVSVFEITFILIILTIFFLILFLIFFILSIFRHLFLKISIPLSVLALIFTLIIPSYFFALPYAVSSDIENDPDSEYEDDLEYFARISDKDPSPTKTLFGEYKKETNRVTWGGDVGWYLSVLGLFFCLMSTIICFYLFRWIKKQIKKDMEKTVKSQQFTPDQPYPPYSPPYEFRDYKK
jgi:hypothetical protein